MHDIGNKERILKIREVFERETDENHELSLKDIVKRLRSIYGPDYTVGEKAIKSDINSLINSGYNLIKNKDEIGRIFYSRQDREFEVYQLRILIDAISSARFINQKDSNNLIKKIKKLTSDGESRKLSNQVYINNRVVSADKSVRYHIDKLHYAIQERIKIKFGYGRYNIKKEFGEGTPGKLYEVDPYGLVWDNSFYYLVGTMC